MLQVPMDPSSAFCHSERFQSWAVPLIKFFILPIRSIWDHTSRTRCKTFADLKSRELLLPLLAPLAPRERECSLLLTDSPLRPAVSATAFSRDGRYLAYALSYDW